MSEEKLSYNDIKEYESLFTMAPPIILSAMIKRNTNLVTKFKSTIIKYLKNLNQTQQKKLKLILTADIRQLQKLMYIAYKKTGKKQYYILANPKNSGFVEMNLNELKKLVNL